MGYVVLAHLRLGACLEMLRASGNGLAAPSAAGRSYGDDRDEKALVMLQICKVVRSQKRIVY